MTDYTKAGLSIRNNQVLIADHTKLKTSHWDDIVYASVFGDRETRIQTRWVIGEVARQVGIFPSSIDALYHARAKGDIPDNFTVPALNLRGITYDVASAIFALMVKDKIGSVIFELAKSEMEYTAQSPEEYATVIMASAIKEGYVGPIFLQADHTQLKSKTPGVAEDDEFVRLTHHIRRCVEAGFYNIDIDASTLVNLDAKSIVDQQMANIDWTLKLAKFTRSIEPENIVISIGGEIGHIGGKTSTVAELEVFAAGFMKEAQDIRGLSKVSVQTGTSHGGVVNTNGTLAKMNVDFAVLSKVTEACKKYQIGGSVQHGASTLSEDNFALFPKNKTLEIHLATGWQNIIMDSAHFPKSLKHAIYKHLLEGKKTTEMTDAQYLYKERKKAWGKFKKETWDIEKEIRVSIGKEISQKAHIIFNALNVLDTATLVGSLIPNSKIKKSIHTYKGD